MANKQNLRKLTTEQAREIGKKGGIASAKAKKEKKMLKDLLEEALSKGTDTDNEYVNITAALIREANKGNVKAYEVIRDTLGQKVSEKVEISMPVDETTQEIDKYIKNKTKK